MQQPAPIRGKKAAMIAIATLVTLAVAAAIALAVSQIASEHSDKNAPLSGPSSVLVDPTVDEVEDTTGATETVLTVDAARSIFDGHEQAKADVDAAAFSRYTCAEFIDADMSQRNQTSVQNLLETYQRAKKYVPVQFIDNPRVIGATSTGTTGKIEVSARVTDNRFVPPTTDERVITYKAVYEEGRWKFCPGVDPV